MVAPYTTVMKRLMGTPRLNVIYVSAVSVDRVAAAQHEIRVYAEAAEQHFAQAMPVTHAAFVAANRVAP